MIIGVLINAPAAFAGTDGDCGSGEICLYYGYVLGPPMYDTPDNVDNYAGKNFYGSSFPLNDNAASAKSRALFFACSIYENAHLGGAVYVVRAGTTANNLGAMANEGSSHVF
jgi:hypothetical protein